jgi:hypothetical protein
MGGPPGLLSLWRAFLVTPLQGQHKLQPRLYVPLQLGRPSRVLHRAGAPFWPRQTAPFPKTAEVPRKRH